MFIQNQQINSAIGNYIKRKINLISGQNGIQFLIIFGIVFTSIGGVMDNMIT
jgi:hypothetical protein